MTPRDASTLPPNLRSWAESGVYVPYGPFGHRVFVRDIGDPHASADRTLLMIHGFPESSYSFHKVIKGMQSLFDRIVLVDMLGYGLSDKPVTHYTYSLFEQADGILTAWHQPGVTGGHILAHDMGDSVTTEILARHENGLLPAWFSAGIRSITFTNGSMVLGLAQLRITQKILLSRWGHLMNAVTTYRLFSQQVRSAHGNNRLSNEDIAMLWQLNCLRDGHQKTYLTIRYLNDRQRFEKTRWLPALAQTSLPIHLCWGDQDNVARVVMAHYLKEHVCKHATLTIMKGLGHFCQLGSPDKWVDYVGAYYSSLHNDPDSR